MASEYSHPSVVSELVNAGGKLTIQNSVRPGYTLPVTIFRQETSRDGAGLVEIGGARER